MMTTTTTPTTAEFLAALFEPDDLVELRPIRHDGGPVTGQQWLTPAALASMNGSLTRLNAEASIYFGANPRSREGGSEADVATCRSVFVDFDGGVTPAQAVETIASAGLPHPTAIVETGGGVHCYWRLVESVDNARFREIQTGLIAKLDSDKSIKDPPRIMRLPGTVNRKPDRAGARCEVVEIAGGRHDAAALAALVVVKRPTPPAAPAPPPRLTPPAAAADDDRERRCRAYLQAMPDAVSGQGGSGTTLQAAAETARFGLDESTARRVLDWFNATKCSPPWSARELDHKFEDAREKVARDGAFGSKLVERKPGAGGLASGAAAEVRPVELSNVRVEDKVDAEGRPVVDKNGDQETKAIALAPAEIRAALLGDVGPVYTLGDGGPLFVQSDADESAIRVLKDPPDLFAWIKSNARVYWRGKADVGGEVLSKVELHSTLRAEPAEVFDQVATLPHHPPMARTFYACPDLPAATGARLAEFIDRLNPDTDADRDLLKAFVLTPAWGGPAGGRPLFILTSDHGRGAGKTATAAAIGHLYQGALSVSLDTRDGVERLRQRILAPTNAALRCVVLDNVKSAASSGEIESLITADVIDGHRLHHGDARRPNSLTWAMTANGVGLSRDLADRSVLVRLGKPKRSDFASWAWRFIDDHRLELIADILAELKASPRGTVDADNRDRWSAWMDGVLSRLPNANALAAEIIDRRGGMDADAEDWAEVKHEIELLVEAAYAYKPNFPVFVPSSTLCARLEHVTGQKFTGRGLATMLNRFTGVSDAARLQKCPSRTHGRGFVWMPEASDQASYQTSYLDWSRLDPKTLASR